MGSTELRWCCAKGCCVVVIVLLSAFGALYAGLTYDTGVWDSWRDGARVAFSFEAST